MTVLAQVAQYRPEAEERMSSYLPALGVAGSQARLYEEFYGFDAVPRDPRTSLADLLVRTAGALAGLEELSSRIRYLLHARTVLAAAPYPVSPLQEVKRRLGLARARTLTVSGHSCASGLLAVDLAGRLLAADGERDALALVLTGEKAFTLKTQLLPNDAVMGEGTAAVLVGLDGDRDRMLGYATQTIWGLHADPWSGEPVPPEVTQRFPQALAETIACAVRRAGIELDEVRMVFPHNVNRLSLLRLAKIAGIDRRRLYLAGIPRVGHCFCADSFMSLQAARDGGLLARGDRYLMVSVGLGTTFSAMVLQH